MGWEEINVGLGTEECKNWRSSWGKALGLEDGGATGCWFESRLRFDFHQKVAVMDNLLCSDFTICNSFYSKWLASLPS